MNIGIIIPHLLPSQLSFDVTNIINKNNSKHSYIVFYENILPNANSPFCPVTNLGDMKYFRSGRLVSFNLGSASLALNSINPINPLLYIHDLEWLRGNNDYIKNLKVMRNIELATRSSEYSTLVENYCNKTCPFISLERVLNPDVNA